MLKKRTKKTLRVLSVFTQLKPPLQNAYGVSCRIRAMRVALPFKKDSPQVTMHKFGSPTSDELSDHRPI